MGMVADRTGAMVPVPKVRKVDVIRDGEKCLLVLTVANNPILTDIGVMRYDRYDDAQMAAQKVRDDVDAGNDPAVLIAMVQAGPAPLPWRLFAIAAGLVLFAVGMQALG